MANTKSAIKRIRQNARRRERNRVITTRTRTFVKKARTAQGDGSLEEARTATMDAIRTLDKAAEKGILHKNNAARRKGRLMAALAKIEKERA